MSIIIPAYNSENHITEAIQRVLNSNREFYKSMLAGQWFKDNKASQNLSSKQKLNQTFNSR